MKSLMHALFGPWPERNESRARRLAYAALCALLVLFAAHAFGWFNLSYSGDAMMIDPTKGRMQQLGEGRVLLPLYWAVRGNLSAPLLVGLLSCLYLSLSVMIIVETLGVTGRCEIALIAGFLCSGAPVTAINASQLHMADASFLALLLSLSGAALCRRAKWGLWGASLLFAAASALDASMVSAGAALLVLAGLFDALDGRHIRGGQGAPALALGLALHGALYALALRHYGLDGEAALQMPLGFSGGPLPAALARAYAYPIVYAAAMQTAHPALCTAIAAALLAFGALALGAALRRLPGCGRWGAILAALLLPLAVNLPALAAGRTGETRETLPFVFLLIGAALLLRRELAARAAKDLAAAGRTTAAGHTTAASRATAAGRATAASRAVAALCAAVFVSAGIFSNQVALKKTLELQATLSVMTRVIDRMEHTQGYEVGATPVALLGSLEDSVLAVTKRGFEQVERFDAAGNRYAPVTLEDYTWYLWEILGYPCNLVSYYENGQFAKRQDVQAMPSFPAQGCCQMIDGVLVVRLSEQID